MWAIRGAAGAVGAERGAARCGSTREVLLAVGAREVLQVLWMHTLLTVDEYIAPESSCWLALARHSRFRPDITQLVSWPRGRALSGDGTHVVGSSLVV